MKPLKPALKKFLTISLTFAIASLASEHAMAQTEKTDSSQDSAKVFEIQSLERLPEFEGGPKGWAKFLMTTLQYPPAARSRGIQGRVITKFVIEKDGSITDVQVLSSPHALLSAEAVRVLGKSPKWLPGIQEGNPVRVAYTLPLTFSLPGVKPQIMRPTRSGT